MHRRLSFVCGAQKKAPHPGWRESDAQKASFLMAAFILLILVHLARESGDKKRTARYFIISIILLAPFEALAAALCAPGMVFGPAGKRAKRNDDHRAHQTNHQKERKAQKSAIVWEIFPQWSAAIIFKMIPFFLFSHSMITRERSDHQAKGSENEHSPNLPAMRLEVSVYMYLAAREKDEKIIQRFHTAAEVRTMRWSPTLIHRRSCQQTRKFNYLHSFDAARKRGFFWHSMSSRELEMAPDALTHTHIKEWEINLLKANHSDGAI